MAYALREGKLGIMDYYDMQNVIADTSMRSSISNAGNKNQTLTSNDKEKRDKK